MGVEHKVHAAVFNAIQKEHKKLTDKNDMADFLATRAWTRTSSWPPSTPSPSRADRPGQELAKKYEITGVPTMIVNGKYRFDIGSAGGAEQALNWLTN
jgi:thiol:disulfide interchange protein DsbA